jgi:hypothetical protein
MHLCSADIGPACAIAGPIKWTPYATFGLIIRLHGVYFGKLDKHHVHIWVDPRPTDAITRLTGGTLCTTSGLPLPGPVLPAI